jgi:hypothetical protein
MTTAMPWPTPMHMGAQRVSPADAMKLMHRRHHQVGTADSRCSGSAQVHVGSPLAAKDNAA